jgi:hypothetical protein
VLTDNISGVTMENGFNFFVMILAESLGEKTISTGFFSALALTIYFYLFFNQLQTSKFLYSLSKCAIVRIVSWFLVKHYHLMAMLKVKTTFRKNQTAPWSAIVIITREIC